MSAGPQTPPPSRLVPFFFGFAVALAAGVPTTLFVLAFVADNVTALVSGVIAGLVVFCLVGALAYGLRHRMFSWVRGQGAESLNDMYGPLVSAARAARDGDTVAAFGALEEAGRVGVAFYGWLLVRRWILRILMGLAAAFAGLVGSALLFQQNVLIREQNEYWREQNDRLQGQIELQARQDVDARRSAWVATLYDELPSCLASDRPRAECPKRASLRARAEVVEGLVHLERGEHRCSQSAQLAATIEAGADCPRPNLGRVDLAQATLPGVDLRWSDLERARFTNANLRGARLDGVVLTSAGLDRVDLSGASLQRAGLRGAKLSRATMEGTDLRAADLTGAHLNGADLANADLRGARLAAADLDDVSLTGALVDPDWPAAAQSAKNFDATAWTRCPSGQLAAKDAGCN